MAKPNAEVEGTAGGRGGGREGMRKRKRKRRKEEGSHAVLPPHTHTHILCRTPPLQAGVHYSGPRACSTSLAQCTYLTQRERKGVLAVIFNSFLSTFQNSGAEG